MPLLALDALLVDGGKDEAKKHCVDNYRDPKRSEKGTNFGARLLDETARWR